MLLIVTMLDAVSVYIRYLEGINGIGSSLVIAEWMKGIRDDDMKHDGLIHVILVSAL